MRRSRNRSASALPAAAAILLSTLSCSAEETDPDPKKESGHEREPNRLIDENSPYLLQHAYNPVNWYPWGEAAFEKAREENKPVFLSVGYSICYWCHVMEKESFEDEEVAEIMNEHFIAIKVDREQRPDVDEQYMLATRIMTGRGGWPNSVWLTPDRKPWMAGTYFPKPRFKEALKQTADFLENRREDVLAQAEQLSRRIERIGNRSSDDDTEIDAELVDSAVERIKARFDERHAGFGSAPKFPPHGTLRLLLNHSANAGEDTELPVSVDRTLRAMWRGGMHDHVGGGFHRYSTDAEWLLPHFEKMLYDNAQLLRIYAEAFHRTGDPFHKRAVADIFKWVDREMTSPDGGFYSAMDSGEVGKEGEYYVWTKKEVASVLNEEKANLFAEVYGFEQKGNFREESSGERTGANIPHLERDLAEIAEDHDQFPGDFREELGRIREQLLEERQTRKKPHKDDKILTSWNGLMIEALAYAGRVLDNRGYTKAAAEAADFLWEEMWTDGRLLRSYRKGKATQPAFLDDYAYFAAGLMALYRTTGDERWLQNAGKLADRLLADFEDQENGGFFLASADQNDLAHRSKALRGGGNLPGANGVAAQLFLDLAESTGQTQYAEAAERTIRAFGGLMAGRSQAKEHLLIAANKWLQQQNTAENTSPPSAASEKPGSGEEEAAKKQNRGKGAEDAESGTDRRQSGTGTKAVTTEKRVKPVTLRAKTDSDTLRQGENTEIVIELDIDDGWHLYGENPDIDFLVPVQIDPVEMPRFQFGKLESPEPRIKEDPILEKEVRTFEDRIRFRLPVRIAENARTGGAVFALKVKHQACDAERCLQPASTRLMLPITIAGAD